VAACSGVSCDLGIVTVLADWCFRFQRPLLSTAAMCYSRPGVRLCPLEQSGTVAVLYWRCTGQPRLWTVCRLSCHHHRLCLRRYRRCRAGRPRRSVSRFKPVGNGAYIVTVPRPSTSSAQVRPVAATAANPRRWSTSARHRHRLRRPVGSRSASSTCVHWQTRSTICSSCDVIAISMSCASLKRGRTPILSLFDVCALLVTKWSIVHARDYRQSCRWCQPTMAEWQLCTCPAFVVVHHSRRWSNIVRVAVCSSLVGKTEIAGVELYGKPLV